MSPPRLAPRAVVQWTGLVAGPVLAAACFGLLPEQYHDPAGQAVEFTREGRVTLAVMTWMAVWWLTEAIDISATALLPIALLPVLGAASIGQATAPYAHNLIFLFLGGFLLALSMQRWGLDRRIALITLRIVGDRPPAMVAGVMLATAVMSMFVSNTATAAMMLPIALSVVHLLRRPEPEGGGGGGRGDANFALCMMPVATPPNAIVFGSGYITIPQMCKAGIWLNIMGILLITALAYAVIMPMLAAGGG